MIVMRNLTCFIVTSFALLICFESRAERIKRLPGEPKPSLTNAQVQELEHKESEKHPVEGYLSAKIVIDRFDAMSYRYSGGRYRNEEIRFRLRSPNGTEPGRKYPLIVWFHGAGESDDDNKRQLAHMQYAMEHLAGPKSLDCFILVTQCPKDNRSWTTSIASSDEKGDAPITYTAEIMEAVIREFPIDENRISVFGLSSGGAAACTFALKYPKRFAGLVTCSASPPPNIALSGTSLWAFACNKDKHVDIDVIREAVNAAKSQGGAAHLTEIDAKSHNSWTEALRERKVLGWMFEQNRLSAFNPPPGVVVRPQPTAASLFCFGIPIFIIVALAAVRVKQYCDKVIAKRFS